MKYAVTTWQIIIYFLLGRKVILKMEEKEELNYIEHFNRIFGTREDKHLRFDMPMLKILFENFEESLYIPNKKYEDILKKKIRILDELENTFTREQREIFNKYNEIENQLTEDVEEQLFMFGYIIASKLSEEKKVNS